MRHLAETPAFVGIGHAKAARLVEAYGGDLPRLLAAGDPAPFVDIVGEEAASTLTTAWVEDLARNDVVVWLDENGIDARLASKIVRLWGAEGARHLREHPYALMALADWDAVDRTALRLGLPVDDPARLVAAVEAALYARLRRQHTWTSHRTVVAEVRRLLGGVGHLAEDAVASAERCGAAFRTGSGWQPAGAAMMEAYVVDRIEAFGREPAMGDLVARDVSDSELVAWLGTARESVGVRLDAEQREAVRLAVKGRFGLILGGAGVGKTTVLRAVCAACDAFGRVVHLMALAGRAAVRMSEATSRRASTIAAFLKACEAGKVTLGPESLVVVDEASMVDLPTFYRLLRHLPEGVRILLVGDEAQLPPIGFGFSLHGFIGMPAVPRVRLTKVYRQAESSGIPGVAADIRVGKLPVLPSRIGDAHGVVLLSTGEPVDADDVVEVVAALGGFDGDLRVISAVKAGPVGTAALNARFHDIMAVGRAKLSGRGFAVCEPVIWGRNDYRRDLRNGSLGEVVSVEKGVLGVRFDDAVHEFAGRDLDDVSLAYAITVHKAQGSQFRTIVMPLASSRLMDRSLVYTALTRATERVVLVGPAPLLYEAVRLPASANRRETGFDQRVAQDAGTS